MGSENKLVTVSGTFLKLIVQLFTMNKLVIIRNYVVDIVFLFRTLLGTYIHTSWLVKALS